MADTISLFILPDRIEKKKWTDVFGEALKLAEAFPNRLMTPCAQEVQGVKRWVWSDRLVDERGVLSFCGDFASRQHGDVFSIAPPSRFKTSRGPWPLDIVCASPATGLEVLFEGDTHGHPYQRAILALGALFESRFPGAALLSGVFEPEDCLQALAWANHVLQRPVSRPVVCDGEALLERLRALSDPEVRETRFLALFCGPEVDRRVFLMKQRSGAGGINRLAGDFAVAGTITLAVMRDMRAWLDVTHDLEGLFRASCTLPEGPGWEVSRILECLAGLWVLHTPDETTFLADFAARGGRFTLGRMALETLFPGLPPSAIQAWYRPGPESVIDALAQVFGGDRADHEREVMAVYARHREQLIMLEQMTQLEEAAPLSKAASDPAPIRLYPHTGESIGRAHRVAWRIRIEELKRAMLEHGVACTPKILRGFIAQAADRGHIVLTEKVWAEIDRETDPEILLGIAYLFFLPQSREGVVSGRQEVMESGLYRALFQDMPGVGDNCWPIRTEKRGRSPQPLSYPVRRASEAVV